MYGFGAEVVILGVHQHHKTRIPKAKQKQYPKQNRKNQTNKTYFQVSSESLAALARGPSHLSLLKLDSTTPLSHSEKIMSLIFKLQTLVAQSERNGMPVLPCSCLCPASTPLHKVIHRPPHLTNGKPQSLCWSSTSAGARSK